ncbi:SgcJ/EcaC family oxidoreductase [Mesorhizobium sp. BH1-1-5]|uniref:SgcJ/EcaC family oxidoreductase n=1 Tax=Mesorhizobium sp. BH1-1-5 TaxID=2876661 RepID=UPI001CCEAE1A|nr:SgcJ/EcaC family oxidoreductase [Mesorhizobium sp. BH1-1-5]MBZ9990859.1 SgcJ/EcaC family oxidoreductase [Mesorhizobium sp. BH1-1-5]
MRLEISKPEDAAAAFADAWNRHDMDDFAVLFSEDANFVNVVGMWWKNRAEIEAAHRATHGAMFRDSRLEGIVSSVVELSPGLASLHYRWTLTGASAPDGSREGILLLVVKKEQSGWRIKVAQNTDIVPGAIAPPPTRRDSGQARTACEAPNIRSDARRRSSCPRLPLSSRRRRAWASIGKTASEQARQAQRWQR